MIGGLLIYGNVLVLGLPLLDVLCYRLTGAWIYSVRAFWVCYALGAAALGIVSVSTGLYLMAALDAGWVALGVWQAWKHWGDDDDDWPGPRKLTEWAKRKLARSQPIPVPVRR